VLLKPAKLLRHVLQLAGQLRNRGLLPRSHLIRLLPHDACGDIPQRHGRSITLLQAEISDNFLQPGQWIAAKRFFNADVIPQCLVKRGAAVGLANRGPRASCRIVTVLHFSIDSGREYLTFHALPDKAARKKNALNDALAAGFAELTVNRGLITPVRDEPRTVFEQAYSPQNMTTPLVRQFSSTDVDDFDGVDVEYFDEVSRQWEVVECRLAGDLGQRVEKMRIAGVTNRTRAWRIGMRKRRAQRYRRWGYTFNTELDAMNSGYLSYVPLLDDVPGYGQSSILVGYAVSGVGAILDSSEPLDWSAGGVHVAGLRRPDGTLSGPFTATRIDDYRLSIASLPDFTPSLDTSSEPPHIYFGPLVRWCYPALITEVSPSGQVGCSVSAINYSPLIYIDDDNSPP